MKNNETGEYELVVGNPQLLSGFFIVVLLCGVAFAMGYVVGQNSPRSAKAQADTAGPGSSPGPAPGHEEYAIAGRAGRSGFAPRRDATGGGQPGAAAGRQYR